MVLFSAKREICCSADGNSLYSCGMNSDNIFTNLIQDTLQIGDITTKSVSCVTLILNLHFEYVDSKFNFKEYVNNRKKAYYKLYALRRPKISNKGKAKILACSVIENQFF